MVVKESERYDADSKQSTAGFEGATNITVDSASIILQEKKNRNENDTGEMNRSKYMNKSKQMENASKKKKSRENILNKLQAKNSLKIALPQLVLP